MPHLVGRIGDSVMAVSERKAARTLRSELHHIVFGRDAAKAKPEVFTAIGVSKKAADALVSVARQAIEDAREGDRGSANAMIQEAADAVAIKQWRDIEEPAYGDPRDLADQIKGRVW
jgi:hypothetical protein